MSSLDTPRLDKRTTAFGVAAAVAVLFNTVLTWAKESSQALHDWMVVATGHHWVTHGLLDLAVFLLVGLLLVRSTVTERVASTVLTPLLLLATVGAGLGLLLWFLLA